MKQIIMMSILVLSVFLLGCNEEPTIGGDKDKHGCLTGAGYQWCESRNKCVRAWEDYCEELKDQFNEDTVFGFDSCYAAGFPVMESDPMQCRGPNGEIYIEGVEPMMSPSKEKAIGIAMGVVKGMNTYNDAEIDISKVVQGRCIGCWQVTLFFYDGREKVSVEVTLEDWNVFDAVVSREVPMGADE